MGEKIVTDLILWLYKTLEGKYIGFILPCIYEL